VPSPAAAPQTSTPPVPAKADAAATTQAEKPIVEVDAELTRHVAELARLKRELAAEKKGKQQLEPTLKEIEEWRAATAKAKDDPIEWLRRAGLTYDDVARKLLGDDAPKPDPVKSELAELKKELDEQRAWRKAQEDAATAARDKAVVDEYRANTEKFVTASAEKLPYLAKLGKDGIDIVWNVILGHAKATGGKEALSPEQAAERVNAHYKKLHALFVGDVSAATQSAPAAQPAADKTAPAGQPKEPTKTSSLTNTLSSGTTTPPTKLTREELYKASVAKLDAEMKAAREARH
jgi:hypothetical protein